ncbi:FtsX-like permease family protein [Nocardioides sp. HM23]|uniref:FtsX-like permease family protein n=1 Tax=Nocardioides bizhenqiangii TaxID=3095076 RepID=UPI002ACAD6ED|nr:FtsX-like permease family protein [Nocardioides sp. HM23]MDZ5620996.1 FtsX-like permease family protein [Nocardioides sp. HM23]
MMLSLSRQNVRQTWRPYAGAFVALTCGILLIATTVSLIASIDTTKSQAGVNAVEQTQLDDLAAMFGFMAAVSLFMAMFVVASTFGFVVATRRQELGLLRLIGATPRQVRRMVLGESAIVALLATVAGCAAATAVLPAVIWFLRWRGVTDLDLQAPAPWLAWSIAAPAGAGVALVGAWRASRRAARVAPVAALQEAAIERRRLSLWQVLIGLCCVGTVVAVTLLSTRMEPLFILVTAILLPEVIVIGLMCFGGILFPALAGLLARPFVGKSVSARLARDHVRTAARTPASLAAPIVAMASIAGSMMVALSFTTDWTTALDREQLAAPLVVEAGSPDVAEALDDDPTVAVADARQPVQLRVQGELEEVEAVDVGAAADARGLHAVRGDLDDLHGAALAISETWRSDSGKDLGDTVNARVDGKEVELRIVAVVKDAPDLYGDLVVGDDLVAEQLRKVAPELFFVVPDDGTSVSEARASIEASLHGTSSRVLDRDAWIEQVDKDARAANNLGLMVLLGPAGLYSAIAIVNTILISASQRRRQVRAIRLLGATPDQLRRMALWEAGLVGVAALLVGGLVTGFVGWLVRRVTTADVADVGMTLPWLPLAAVAATCAGLVVVGALAGSRSTLRAGA